MSEQSLLKPVCTEATVYKLPIEITSGIHAMVITGNHFDKTQSLSSTLPVVAKDILKIVLREKVTCIIILGDVIDAESPNQNVVAQIVLSIFESFPIPVYIMGGHNDRHTWAQMPQTAPGSSVKIVQELSIVIENSKPVQDSLNRVVLTHDLMNNYSLRPTDTENYMLMLRNAVPGLVGKEDFLISGYPQEFYFSEEQKVLSLRPFSKDMHKSGYALVKNHNGLHVTYVK